MSANPPIFKPLRAYLDPVSAGDWNALTAAVTNLCRSMGADGLFDSAGLHIRGRRHGVSPGCYKIVSNDGGGAYTVRPQLWDESSAVWIDRPEADDIPARDIRGSDRGAAGDIVAVRLEASLQGQWLGLMDLAGAMRWGVVAADWSAGNSVELHPCDDETGGNPSQGTITCYIHAPIDGDGPSGCDLKEGDVAAYWPFTDASDVPRGMLISPPIQALPPGGGQDYALTKASGDDYDVHWDLIRYVN